MKRLLSMFLAVIMVATTAVAVSMPAFAATSTITPGGNYATQVWDDELNFVTAPDSYTGTPYTVDNTEKTMTVSVDSTSLSSATANFNTDGTTAIDLSGIRWNKSGKIIVTYDAELISKTEGMVVKAGLIGKVEASTGVNKWPYGGTGTAQQPMIDAGHFSESDEIGTVISVKNEYNFAEDGLTIYPYTYDEESGEYVLAENAPVIKDDATFAENHFYIYKLLPYIQTRTVKGEAVIEYSNIVITEIYEEAKLQPIADTYAPTDVVDIGINLPADYASARLTIGGVEYANMASTAYPAGAYNVSADLSRLTYCGDMDVVLDIIKEDGSTEKLTDEVSVVMGPEMTSYGVEDFEDETCYYSLSTSDNIGITDIPAATGRTGKAYGVTTKNNNNGALIKIDFPSPYIAEGTCVDIDFDVYLTGMYSHIQLYMKDLDNSAQWNAVMGYGCAVPLNNSAYNYLLGKWIDVRLTIDTVNNCVDIYCEGEYIATKSITNHQMNGLKTIYLSPKVTPQADHFIYIDNVEFSSYIPGNKPAVASVTTNHDNGTIALEFDSAVAYTEGSITLDGIASTVAYDEATFTATITPTDALTALNGTIVVAESVAGYAMTIPATLPVELPFISNMALTVEDGVYTGAVDVYNDGVEDIGKIYVAIYNESTLAKVVSAPVVTVNGAATFSAPLTPDAAGTYTAQMFFWNADLSPVTGVVTPR